MRLDRRTLLIAGAATGAAGAAATWPIGPAAALAPPYRGPLRTNPFTLGVASGDPDPDGFVLWTRLAVNPLAADGRGGMPNRNVAVQWELASDATFRSIVRSGTVQARPQAAHSVHVELDGLPPGREFHYRFRAEKHLSRVGRTRTAPATGSSGGVLNMAFASCSQFEHGYFTAYRHLADDEPDLILHLGDYIYEYAPKTHTSAGGNVRAHKGPETITLANYRQRHAQYKTDRDLQAAHAVAPWAVVFDDHEVENNWADEVPEQPDRKFLARRKAALQAYYENMPLRRSSVPHGIDMQLYRRLHWGQLATFHLLDTRQFRSNQGCGDGYKACPAAAKTSRSITGAVQERWLLDGFARSTARWDVLGQQVFFAQQDITKGPGTVVSQDAWDGYTASRDRITRGWLRAKVRNPVVLTGDVHAHWVSDLKLDYADPTSRTVGTELICSSISSNGNGTDVRPAQHPWQRWNPHLRFYNSQRGYVRTRLSQDEMTVDFQVVPYVTRTGAPVHTRAKFVIEDRVPGVHPVSNTPTPGSAAVTSPDRIDPNLNADGKPLR